LSLSPHATAAARSLSSATATANTRQRWRQPIDDLPSSRRLRSTPSPSSALPPGLLSGGGDNNNNDDKNKPPTYADPLPAGLRVEPDADGKEVSYDEGANVVRIPLAMMGDDVRRKKLVLFTCKPCGARTARLVNPLAYEKGVVFAQCGGCGAWHTLAANNPKIYEEIRYSDDATSSSGVSDQTVAGAAGGDDQDGATS
jgi:hypothetical protein